MPLVTSRDRNAWTASLAGVAFIFIVCPFGVLVAFTAKRVPCTFRSSWVTSRHPRRPRPVCYRIHTDEGRPPAYSVTRRTPEARGPLPQRSFSALIRHAVALTQLLERHVYERGAMEEHIVLPVRGLNEAEAAIGIGHAQGQAKHGLVCGKGAVQAACMVLVRRLPTAHHLPWSPTHHLTRHL